MRHVGIPRRVDDALGQDGLTPRLALRDDAADPVAIHNRRCKSPVQHWLDTGFLDQVVRNDLEGFRIERIAV